MIKHTFRNTILLVVLLFVGSCKSIKTISGSGYLEDSMTIKKIIKSHEQNTPEFNTLQGKVKVAFTQGERTDSYNLNLRMQKDKVIWLNATLSLVRAKITPEGVGFYNKLDNTYFDGDYTLINDLLGTTLTFQNIQNVLLGSTLFDTNTKDFALTTHEESYVLAPKDQDTMYEIFMLLNPKHFRADSQQVAQMLQNRMLQIDYLDYQDVEEKIFPKNIKVFAVDGEEETIIALELKSVSLDKELRYPFNIPSGFDEMKF